MSFIFYSIRLIQKAVRLLFLFAFFEQEKSNIPSFILPNGRMQCFGHIPPFSSEAVLGQVAVVSQAVLCWAAQRKANASKDKCLEKSNII